MKRRLFTVVGIVATSLCTVASAATVTYTYNFADGKQNVAGTGGNAANSGVQQTISGNNSGMVFSSTGQYYFAPTASGPAVGITAEYAASGLKTSGLPSNPCTPGTSLCGVDGRADDGQASSFTTTSPSGTGPLGLFEVTTGENTNTANGIAPYRTDEDSGSSPHLGLTGEDGVTENYVLLLNLSNVAAGSTVSFVMSTGSAASTWTGINVYEGNGATTPTAIGGAGPTPLNIISSLYGYTINGSAGGAAVSGQITIPGTTTANEWIAIQADCHYLVLTSLTITSPTGVPEPSFYGFFALAMVGLAFGARKLRARTAVAATEQA